MQSGHNRGNKPHFIGSKFSFCMLRVGTCCWYFNIYIMNRDQDHLVPPMPNRRWSERYLQKRSTTYKLQHVKKFLQLLLSPRTIMLQCTSFLMIYLLTHIKYLSDNLDTLGTAIDLRVITMIMSFSVIFSINQSFQRRERTLQDIAKFKSNLSIIYYCLHQTKNIDIYDQVSVIIKHLVKYMTDTNELRYKRLHSHEQKQCIAEFYQISFDLVELVKLDNDSPKEAFLNGQIQSMIEMFERICATKDYRTPLAVRTFSVMMIYLFPLILSPYFVWHQLPQPVTPYSGAYFWSWLFFLLFGALLDVKKTLDNIFDGELYAEDIQIHIDEVLEIIHSPTKKDNAFQVDSEVKY